MSFYSLGDLEGGSQRNERLMISMQKIKDINEVPSKPHVHIYHVVICSCVPWWLIKSHVKNSNHKFPIANARLVFKSTLKDI